MNIILIIMYIIVGIYMIYKLLIKNKKNNFVGAYSGILFGCILYYFVVPILILLNKEMFINSISEEQRIFFEKSFEDIIFPLILIIIGFIVFDCAYNQSLNKSEEKKAIIYNSNKLIKITKIIAFFSLFIGGISLLIFLASFGGIREAFSYAQIVRSFSNDLSNYISKSSSLLIVPARLIVVAPFTFWILLKEGNVKNKIKIRICFIISVILAIMYYIFNTGRAPFIYFILSFLITYSYKFLKKPWKYVLILAIIAMPLLDIFDSFSLYLQIGKWREIDVDYMNYLFQFSYPFKNVINMVEIGNEFGFRLGQDFITSIIGMLPGIDFQPSYVNTSMYYNGINWETIGGTPNDLVTFAYIQFGIIGIPLILGILGYIVGKIDKALSKITNKNIKTFLCTVMAIYFYSIVSNADFCAIIKSGFVLIGLSIIVLNSYSRRE